MTNPATPEFLALQQLLAGRYSIERELGRGGMGIVLLARDVALDRLVAIKLLPSHYAASAEARDRFLREARTAAGLSHPNIVPIHAVEQHGDLVFFVMGFVDGETLRERVARTGPLPPRLATKVMQEVAWALAYAHQRGVIHRDIKPDNIMIERATDRALVTDFGIAVGGRAGGAGAGEVIGTAQYMSPEQACGEAVDARSDLYSLGATVFFALTGQPPFEAANLPAVLVQQVSRPAPLVQAIRPEVPARLGDLIDRCLQKDPAARVQTGDEVARIVDEVRGRDLRAPPLVRSFLRNAQVSTMVILASGIGGGTVHVGQGGTNVSLGGAGIIGTILVIQLVGVARRLLREGYAFADIRTALLAEAQVQREEAEELKQGRRMQWLNSLWHKWWASRFGRAFFWVAGLNLKAPERRAIASAEPTELVLGHSALAAFEALPEAARSQVHDVPAVIARLEREAEALRAQGRTGDRLAETVAALENLRLATLKLGAGTGTVGDLTLWLERAREVGEHVDRRVEAEAEVRNLLKG
ncbi:MAG TPA: serine/threonine-protein kinase [Gemmatimonadales bacterium]|nr:serine/threonine-protein kinase [Gemmatimonadales bacterium]